MAIDDNPEAHKKLDVVDSSLQPADKALDHAWRYFGLHAQQRISVFNFFVVLSGILATGIGAGLQAGKHMTPVVLILGLLLALFSFVFYRLDGRGAELVKLAEAALMAGENTCMPEFARIVVKEANQRALSSSQPRTWTFGRSFRLIFWVMGTAGIIVSSYALFRIITENGVNSPQPKNTIDLFLRLFHTCVYR